MSGVMYNCLVISAVLTVLVGLFVAYIKAARKYRKIETKGL